jgi:hypothetical protein
VVVVVRLLLVAQQPELAPVVLEGRGAPQQFLALQ